MTASARALLASLIDYAGLFPPAGLSMAEAAAEYARWRRSPEAWMLGRFVLPAQRLDELAGVLAGVDPGHGEPDAPWPLSVLLGPGPADAERVAPGTAVAGGRARIDVVELKGAAPREIEAALAALPAAVVAYVELETAGDPAPLLAVLRERGARAKLRTGGVTPQAIPAPAEVARFITACAAAGVPFKATAGLHHALRASHPLGYGPDAPRAVLHGFINVFGGAALLHGGASAELEAVLCEEDPSAFRLDADGLAWRQHRVSTLKLAECRASLACSFGSCSFAEPVADLRALGVIP
ncbi:MAG: hypothetical protein ACM3PV_07650 [Betaproteobacteria bacterium]